MKKLIRIFLIVIAIMVTALTISYMISGNGAVIVNRVLIKKSPSEVFDYISNMRNELNWNPDVLFMEKMTNGNIGLGTKFKAKWHLSDTLEVSITKFEPPHEIFFENGGPVEVNLQVTLTQFGSSTELESKFIAKPHGFIRAIFPIFKSQIKAQEKENMINLKKALEK